MHRWRFAEKIFWTVAIIWTLLLLGLGLLVIKNKISYLWQFSLMAISPLIGLAIRRWHEYAKKKKIQSLNPR